MTANPFADHSSAPHQSRRDTMTMPNRETGECGTCDQRSDFYWSPVKLPQVDDAVMVCHDHGALAPGWAYDESPTSDTPVVNADDVRERLAMAVEDLIRIALSLADHGAALAKIKADTWDEGNVAAFGDRNRNPYRTTDADSL